MIVLQIFLWIVTLFTVVNIHNGLQRKWIKTFEPQGMGYALLIILLLGMVFYSMWVFLFLFALAVSLAEPESSSI